MPAAEAHGHRYFDRTATYPVYLNNGSDPQAETVAEISAVSSDGNTLIYTDAVAKQLGFLDITDPQAPQGRGTLSLSELGDTEGEPTSVAVHGDYVLVVINTSDSFTEPSGRVDIVRVSDHERVRSIELPGQPDSIAVAPDGSSAAIAIENERDEDAGDGGLPQQPPGQLTFLHDLDSTDPADWTSQDVDIADDLSGIDGIDTPQDPEPEYVAYSPDSSKVALTLQENNAIAIFDPTDDRMIKAFTAGTDTVSGVDTKEDDQIDPTGTITDVPREPDGITWLGDDHLATANEGDWKGGTRGWSVFDARTGKVAWDAGNTFDREAIRLGLYPESRSEDKGTEPEGIAHAEFGGTPYVFVSSERGNFVAVYDVSDPTAPRYVQTLPTTNGPEGVLPIPGRNLLAVSSEEDDPDNLVRASVGLFSFGSEASGAKTSGAGKPFFPSIESADVDGAPIPWSALGALTADQDHPTRLYSTTDAAYTPTRILGIDTARTPATIDTQLTITKDGKPYGLDAEGIYQRPDGSFWIAAEGATGPENKLVEVAADGAVQQEIGLPAEIADQLGKQGLEGVTAQVVDGTEQVYVAVQRELSGDPKGTARIGRYTPATKTWTWYGYPLDSTATAGDWIGLSEITAVDDHRLAVIERDKLNGPDAKIKKVYTVELPADSTGGSTGVTRTPADSDAISATLKKTEAVDVLPLLQKTNGWTQEKLEGLTIARNGKVFAITDNDGVKDATGETVFLRLGNRNQMFGPSHKPGHHH
ncbi:esterase-like activity of phytase family protein [Microlunatus soli]|nr:esterase-like activity of phytase family protein [Microlunatus soli]